LQLHKGSRVRCSLIKRAREIDEVARCVQARRAEEAPGRLVESKVGTAETEMDEGKPAAVTARDSETDSEQRAQPGMTDTKM
jgi:hypothetical protein